MNDNRSRMAQAIDYIEEHLLDDSLNLSRISEGAGFSPYHFSRTFQALVGEPVVEYVKKRRLDAAANMLVETDKRIIEIAVECGFSSQEAFARAFSKAFGWPPGVYRRLRPPRKRYNRIEALSGEHPGFPLDPPRFETLERRLVYGIGKRVTLSGYAGARSILSLWKEFCERTMGLPRVKELYGLGIYDLERVLGDGDSFEYFACVHLTPGEPIPKGFDKREIPGGLYAIFNYAGPPRRTRDAFDHIFGTWFPSESYGLRVDPSGAIGFECYKTDSIKGTLNHVMSIYVPVEPLYTP